MKQKIDCDPKYEDIKSAGDLENPKLIKETNDFITKYQREDINEKLIKLIGNDFKEYRKKFNKTQENSKGEFIPKSPITIALELINRCNLNCIMCYKKHHTKPLNKLSLESIRKILKECKDNKIPSIILGFCSETLIYKDTLKVLDLIKEHEILDVFFGTNGVLLTEEIIKKIVDNKISRIEISLDAATPGTYKKIRGKDNLELIEKNIERLLEYKRKTNNKLPIIRLCFVLMDINKHEAKQFLNKWKDKVDYIDFQRQMDFTQVDKDMDIKEEIKEFCSYPFYSLGVLANGDVTPCCTFYGTKLIIGNIHKQTLQEIWDGEKIKEFRKQIIFKEFNPICKKCLYSRDKNLFKKFGD